MEQKTIESEEVYTIDEFWEFGAEYVYMPYHPEVWDAIGDEGRYSNNLDLLKRIADQEKRGAVFRMVGGVDHEIGDTPIYTP